jgi:hypothetical protein
MKGKQAGLEIIINPYRYVKYKIFIGWSVEKCEH